VVDQWIRNLTITGGVIPGKRYSQELAGLAAEGRLKSNLVFVAPIDRRRLVDALDTLADAAIAIEAWSDGKRSLDPDELVAQLRGVSVDLALELKASDLLDDLRRRGACHELALQVATDVSPGHPLVEPSLLHPRPPLRDGGGP
jgi:hypothetical protein